MKARAIETGKIVEVVAKGNYYDTTDNKERYYSHELDFQDTTDYWTRLEHQCAGMAMQTMLATLYNPKYHKELMAGYTEVDEEEVARLSKVYAHALVEKYKKEEK